MYLLIYTGLPGFVAVALEGKAGTGVVAVMLHGIGCERQHVDPVAVLQYVQISVSGTYSYDVAHAGYASDSCTHPQYVMIAPLYVYGMVVHKGIHYQMRSGASVVYIADDVEMIHNKALNKLGKSYDKILCPSYPHYGI